VRWLKKNLFSTWYDALLTVLAVLFLFFVARAVLNWVLFTANWAPITNSVKLLAVGQFPQDQIWRMGAIVLVVSFLFGLSWRVWGGTVRTFALTLAIALGLIALLPVSLSSMGLNIRLWFLLNPFLTAAGYLLGRVFLGKSRWVALGWLLALVLLAMSLAGLEAVSWVWRGPAFILIVLYLLVMSLRVSGAMIRVRVSDSPALRHIGPILQPLVQILDNLMGVFLGKPLRVLSAWVFVLVLAALRLSGVKGISWLPPVETGLWGGLLLTFLLALVGIVASFPIGLLLALGRRSSLPVVKAFCVLFIEMVRGVPLVTILFLSSIILPLFLPGDVRIDRVLRAMIGMTLFAAAYMAENVRGGLQAISRGQVEAARAVGLNNFQTMALIVLPQALRLVIPAIVGQFIALFMDTTLAVIVNLLELLGMGRSVLESKVEWKLLNMEMFLFIAVMFWIFNFAMSYASRRLEAALGVGER
jgi:His/Glu/Gln/Arg/opine family amino acid ABC transporter permease subunit